MELPLCLWFDSCLLFVRISVVGVIRRHLLAIGLVFVRVTFKPTVKMTVIVPMKLSHYRYSSHCKNDLNLNRHTRSPDESRCGTSEELSAATRLRILGFSAILVVLFKFAMTPILGFQAHVIQLVISSLFLLGGGLLIVISIFNSQ